MQNQINSHSDITKVNMLIFLVSSLLHLTTAQNVLRIIGRSNFILILMMNQQVCTGVTRQPNISVRAGQDVSLGCDLTNCPPASSITWLRSDQDDLRAFPRYPLVSDHPTMLTVKVIMISLTINVAKTQEAMPADSGWYWCDTDSYQIVTHVTVENLVSMMDIVTSEMRSHYTTESPTLNNHDPVSELKRGNADQLQVYETYQSKWQDKQVYIY